ncbi:MAG: AAA family ATPase [Ruminococcus sp.]
MEQTFLTNIEIKKVRHLENISIPLDKNKRKHLILTGKNGSGKTSVLEELVQHFNYILSDQFDSYDKMKEDQRFYIDRIEQAEKISDLEKRRKSIQEAKKMLEWIEDKMKNWLEGVVSNFTSYMVLREKYQKGNFIFAYYKAEREFQVEEYKNIEKIEFQDKYSIAENPGTKFTKYLVDVKATQAFTKNKEKAEKIDKWFQAFEDILRRIFNDKNLQLKFDDETFQFSICETDRDPFDFNTMSSGYSAVFDIINDLIIRMEAKSGLRTEFDMEGVVLVDEIETHLHLELQTMSVFSENQIPENLTLQKLSA